MLARLAISTMAVTGALAQVSLPPNLALPDQIAGLT